MANPSHPKASGGGPRDRAKPAGPPVPAAPADEVLPGWDVPEVLPATPADADTIPVAAPVRAEDLPADAVPEVIPVAVPVTGTAAQPGAGPAAQPGAGTAAVPPGLRQCPFCGAARVGEASFCFECGLLFSEAPPAPAAGTSPRRVGDRYEVQDLVAARGSLRRYRGTDLTDPARPRPVVVLEAPAAPSGDTETEPHAAGHVAAGHVAAGHVAAGHVAAGHVLDEPRPAADETPTGSFSDFQTATEWPGLGWEWHTLNRASHPGLPRVLDQFGDAQHAYLVEEVPEGRSLWDAWDDPGTPTARKYEWLAQVAETLRALHSAGAMVEGLRPDIVTVTPDGRAVLNTLADLLPLPLPPGTPVQATLYSAPELVTGEADARADLYGFGAMLYALHLGRELTEMDFERQGVPKPFVLQFPDAHPAVARVVMKTFVRERDYRLPTEDAVRDDPTGFVELVGMLRAAGRTAGQCRLDIAGWTTTGMVRTGNEDAFALVHAAAGRQDDLGERALLLLADGMGGYEAGEVASALAIDFLRRALLKEPLFAGLTGDVPPAPEPFDVGACQALFANVLREANKAIHTASRTPGQGRRGMGCTAEVVYLDGRRLVAGHVGDSRVYHYSDGRLNQVTRDQTLVNRLVELGHLSPEEAEDHPRKNELQQALGSQPTVDPGVYSVDLKPGDWVLVCSDGLPGHVDHATLTEMIQRADSAEMCARRLVNLANLQGGSDNTTVIVVRLT
jgi:serine/threonine protein phosphatase PrpC